MLQREIWWRGRVHLGNGDPPHGSMKTITPIRILSRCREQIHVDVLDGIEAFFHRTRRHNHLDGPCPEAYERTSALGRGAT